MRISALTPDTGAYRPAAPATALPRLQTDSIHFSGSVKGARLLKKYGIDPKKVRVEPANATLATDKRTILIKIIEAHEQAKKHRAIGNFSSRYFSSNVLLANGTWSTATNIEQSRQKVLCGERSAVVIALNKALEKMPYSELPEEQAKMRESLKIKLLTFSEGSKVDTHWDACAECLGWMGTDAYFSPDTQLATLNKDTATGEWVLKVGSVQGHLPMLGKRKVSMSEKDPSSLPVTLSAKARESLASRNWDITTTERIARNLIHKAKDAYFRNESAELSGKNVAAAVYTSPGGNITAGQKFDWTQRWNTSADMVAGVLGVASEQGQDTPPKIEAIAYYGDEPTEMPSENSMGPISQKRGEAQTLIVTIEDETIQVRTLREYMPFAYMPSTVNNTKK